MTMLSHSARLALKARAAWDWCQSASALPPDLDERRDAIRQRLVAWWNGDDPDANHPLPDTFDDDEEGMEPGEPEPAFSPRRLRVIEQIWGDGFLEPGGERFARKLLAVLSVTSKQTVLDLTAGLGGSARALASQRSLWMETLEPIAELAAEGRHRSAIAKMGKRVAITHADLDKLALRKDRYHVIFSRERLCGIASKEHILDQCAIGLKDHGQILLTDFVARHAKADQEWPERGGAPVHMWSLDRYRSEFDRRGLLVQMAQDMTDEYLQLIHAAWIKVPSLLATESFSPRSAALVIDEGELWRRRSEALASGAVAMVRLHATLSAA